jgi:Putative beta barrel porin-7 (BBP7)
MRKGFLGTLAALAAGAGLTFGQSYPPPPGPGGPADFGYYSPDGNPVITPPGMEGMIPPGAMGSGPYGSGGGIFNSGNGAPPRIWFGADYLYWMPRSLDIQYPLVTTSAPADLGVLGAATTASLCGPNSDVGYSNVNGFRAWGGCAVGDGDRTGIEVGGFWLETKNRTFAFASNGTGSPVLAVPFVDLQTGVQGAYVVSSPGIASGSIVVGTEFHAWGVEANCVFNLYRPGADAGGLEFLVGARFFELEERLTLDTSSTAIAVPPIVSPSVFFPGGGGLFAGNPVGLGTITTSDSIRTFNEFYGAQVGFRGEKGLGKFSLAFTGKVAAGMVREWVELDGASASTVGGTASVQPGGILNLAQDLCKHRTDRFAWMPEGNINLACYITPKCRIQVGYSFMWISNVLRPTSVTTPVLAPSLIPTSPTFTGAPPGNVPPRDLIHDTDFFLHGFNVGFQISF